ncbi:MAG: hypothetical protein ACJ704_15520 [Nitrososphaeraceae archaeon]
MTSKIGALQAKKQQQSFQLLQSVQIQQPQKDCTNDILVIDHEPGTQLTYEYSLSEEGYNVKAFSDPREALKHFFLLRDP